MTVEGLRDAVTGVQVELFLREVPTVEGLAPIPSRREIVAAIGLLRSRQVTEAAVMRLQAVLAPGCPLRDRPGMDSAVDGWASPPGGPQVSGLLRVLCAEHEALPARDPWELHVRFARLRPFADGNGRVGRVLWAWQMLACGRDPFERGFLREFYYQTLRGAR